MLNRVILIFALFIFGCEPASTPSETKKEVATNQTSKEIVDVIEYHPNGAVKIRGKSQGGKRLGRWESFYANGLRWSESEYRNGYRQGDAVSYYPNGMMRYQGLYYNDEPTGIWSFYDTSGVRTLRLDMDLPQDEREGILDSLGIN
ncbi:MAG: hypothetical protein MK086_05880 [Flavobacteriales bacterium]|nr:hypothetical protein [Flavobacteriales bacterium]